MINSQILKKSQSDPLSSTSSSPFIQKPLATKTMYAFAYSTFWTQKKRRNVPVRFFCMGRKIETERGTVVGWWGGGWEW